MTFWESLDSSLVRITPNLEEEPKKRILLLSDVVLVVGTLTNIVFGFYASSYTDEMNNIVDVLISTMSDPNITEADSEQAILKFYAEFDEAMANSPIIVK